MPALFPIAASCLRISSGLPPMRAYLGAVIIAVWVCLVGCGFGWLLSYKATPGVAAEDSVSFTETTFPAHVSIEQHPQLTLLLFAHPCCPCTAASLRELSKIIAARPELQPAEVIFALPPGAPAAWRTAPLVEIARQSTGVKVTIDENAQLTRQFGAQTSGQVLLFDAAGRRVFSGGITPLRGHEGWSAGQSHIIAACNYSAGPPTTAPVFGCPLLNHAQRAGGGS